MGIYGIKRISVSEQNYHMKIKRVNETKILRYFFLGLNDLSG
jgi:hypothetical protein